MVGSSWGGAGNGKCGKDTVMIHDHIRRATHCIGFEIISQSSQIFCDSLTCHYPSKTPTTIFSPSNETDKYLDLSLLANRNRVKIL